MSDSQSGEDGGLGDEFDESDEDLELDDDDDDNEVFELFNHTRGGKRKKPRLEVNELQELLKDAETDISDLAPTLNDTASPKKKRRKTQIEPSLFNREEEDSSEPPKKKQKTGQRGEDSTKPRAIFFDLVEPEFEHSRSKPTPSPSISAVADSFGEQTVLQSFDAADKRARRKSLRFHTSKIEGSATRRDKGTKNLLGGDDDIPYKERKKQKEIREAKEIEKKGRGRGGDDLSDGDPEMDMDVGFPRFDDGVTGRKPGEKRSWDELSGEADEEVDPSEYYSLVERSAKERKEKKKAGYNAAKAAQRYASRTSDLHMPYLRCNLSDTLMTSETADGPRALTRAILKNRGLTPHRSKSVRNPRVKKRMKFEKAKKKVSSQKAVYKSGIGDMANYGGEKSGISKVVKAVRL